VSLDLVYGRDELLGSLLSDLGSGRSVALVGGRKIGKTTVLRKLEIEILSYLASGNRDHTLIPAYVDTLALAHPTSQFSIYFEILRELEKNLAVAGLNFSLLKRFESGVRERGLEFSTFRASLLACVREITNSRKVRFAVLLDEVEPITQSAWSSGFFGNWRHLISNDPEISPWVTAIFSGAKEMSALSSDIGSPIANVLSLRMLGPLSWPASRALVNEPTKNELPPIIARRIFSLTGGHPFLIQFLMQQVCNFAAGGAEEMVDKANGAFFETQSGQFSSWWNDRFSEDDRRVYLLISGLRGVQLPKICLCCSLVRPRSRQLRVSGPTASCAGIGKQGIKPMVRCLRSGLF